MSISLCYVLEAWNKTKGWEAISVFEDLKTARYRCYAKSYVKRLWCRIRNQLTNQIEIEYVYLAYEMKSVWEDFGLPCCLLSDLEQPHQISTEMSNKLIQFLYSTKVNWLKEGF